MNQPRTLPCSLMEGMMRARLSSQSLTSSYLWERGITVVENFTLHFTIPRQTEMDKEHRCIKLKDQLLCLACLCLRALGCWIKRGAAFGAQSRATNWSTLTTEHVAGSPQQTERSCVLTEAVVVHPVLLRADTAKSNLLISDTTRSSLAHDLWREKYRDLILKINTRALKLKWNPYFCRSFSCLHLPTAPGRAKQRRYLLVQICIKISETKRSYSAVPIGNILDFIQLHF